MISLCASSAAINPPFPQQLGGGHSFELQLKKLWGNLTNKEQWLRNTGNKKRAPSATHKESITIPKTRLYPIFSRTYSSSTNHHYTLLSCSSYPVDRTHTNQILGFFLLIFNYQMKFFKCFTLPITHAMHIVYHVLQKQGCRMILLSSFTICHGASACSVPKCKFFTQSPIFGHRCVNKGKYTHLDHFLSRVCFIIMANNWH